MRQILLSPLFAVGLALRLLVWLAFQVGDAATEAMAFVSLSRAGETLDPWQTWISGGGATDAFPYGYAMWVAFLPLALASKITGLSVTSAYFLTLLVFDFLLLVTVTSMVKNRKQIVLVAYWLSPIVIFPTYALGLNDVVPVVLLVLSVATLGRLRVIPSGIFLALAISAKLSMLVALPILMLVFRDRRTWSLFPRYAMSLLGMLAALWAPFLASDAARTMLFEIDELSQIFVLRLTLGETAGALLVPLLFLFFLYLLWRQGRLGSDLLLTSLGVVFVGLALLVPGSIGWLIWGLPFIAVQQASSDNTGRVLFHLFAISYLLYSFLGVDLVLWNGFQLPSAAVAAATQLNNDWILLSTYTLVFATGVVGAARMWRQSVASNDFLEVGRKPFSVAIAGDSGSGKDTLADALAGVVGSESASKLSGDDYHLWNRGQGSWAGITHLNPAANSLEAFERDFLLLRQRRQISVRPYSHSTGRIGRPVRIQSRPFLVVPGLHSLWLPGVRDTADLRVFLDMEEGLRRKLKLKRDFVARNQEFHQIESSLRNREIDSQFFIAPQKSHADLVFRVEEVSPVWPEDWAQWEPSELVLRVEFRRPLERRPLTRVIVGLCGLRVEFGPGSEDGFDSLAVWGTPSREDIERSVLGLCPEMADYLSLKPAWQSGVVGLMQLFVLFEMSRCKARGRLR